MRTKSVIIQIVILALLSALFVLWGREFIVKSSFRTFEGARAYSLVDDAMISMRYAWNFSHGRGLVWNPGEYVQGYTNLLMTLIMSVATYFLSKSMAVLAIQVLGMALMLLIAFFARSIAHALFVGDEPAVRTAAGVLAFAGPLVYYPLAYWSLMGMETGLLTVLLLAALAALFWYQQSGKLGAVLLCAFLFGLAFLTRNESVLFFILAWAYLAWRAREQSPALRFGHLLAASLVMVFLILAELTFQRLYYGDWLPNTYTLKLVGIPFALRLRNGLHFVRPFLGETALLLVMALGGALWSFRKEKLFLLSFVLTAILYQVCIGGDVWNYWRIMAPAIPLVIILDIALLADMGRWIARTWLSAIASRPPWRHVPAIFFALVGVGIGLGLADARFSPEIFFRQVPYEQDDNRHNVNIAIALNRVFDKDATIGVTWAGALPYYTDFKAVDFLGKADRYIAHLPPDLSDSTRWYGMTSVPGHNKYDLTYSIMTLRPTYVERFVWGKQDLSEWAEDNYVEVEYKRQSFFVLKGSPDVTWSEVKLLDATGAATP